MTAKRPSILRKPRQESGLKMTSTRMARQRDNGMGRTLWHLVDTPPGRLGARARSQACIHHHQWERQAWDCSAERLRTMARSLLSGGPKRGGLCVCLGNRRAALHNSTLGKFVGPNCARDTTCSDGPQYWTFWAPPHRRRVSLQCSSLLNTEYFFLLFTIQEI